MNAALLSSKRMDWETPPELFGALDREFKFNLDVCASPRNAKCLRFFSERLDGLRQEWGGAICWMNPPYGRAIGLWMKKAFEESQRAATVVCLVPSRTDTAWWHEFAARGEIRFLRGRVKFVGATSCAPFPSAIVIFRNAKAA